MSIKILIERLSAGGRDGREESMGSSSFNSVNPPC